MSWAHEHGRLPSEVYEEYLTHKRDYRLLMAFTGYKAEREQEEVNKARK